MTDKLTLLAGIASDWWWETDADLRLTFLSDRFTELFGLPISEMIGKQLQEISATDSNGASRHAYINDLASRRAFRNFESAFVDAAGIARPVMISGSPIWGVDGIFGGYIGVGHDLTELRSRERDAATQAANLESIFQSIDQGVVLLDGNLRIVAYNRRLAEFLRFDEAIDFRGMAYEHVVRLLAHRGEYAPEEEESAVALRMDMVRSATPVAKERLRPDGRIMLVTFHPLPTGGGVMTYSDVTDARRREETLRDLVKQVDVERDKLVVAQSVANVGSWETDFATLTVTWSDQTFRIFDVEPTAFKPTHSGFLAFVHPDDRAAVDEAFRRSFDSREVQEIEHRIFTHGGQLKFVVERWQTFLDGDGNPKRAVGTCQDITDLKLARQKADEAADLMRVAGRAARLGGWITDVGTGRVVWSDVTAEIHDRPHGYSPTIEEGLSYYAPEYRARIESVYARCASEGVAFDETLQILTAKGRRLWVHAVGEAVRDSEGKIMAVHGAFQDISELMAARAETRRIADRLYETLENINDSFVTIDKNWCFSFVNKEAMRILRRSDSDLLGKNIWQEYPDMIGSNFERHYRRAVDTQEMTSFSEYYPGLDSWFRVRAYPSADGLAVYFQDITENRRQQEHLRLLETAVSKLNDIVLITEAWPLDAPGPRIVYVNEAFTKVTGYSREEAIGRTPRLLQGPETSRQDLDRIRSALEKGQSVDAELSNRSKGGKDYWIEMNIVPIFSGADKPTHFVAIQRDITERKRIEQTMALSVERFRIVAQLSTDIVWDWDLVANTVWRNDEGIRKFGYENKPFHTPGEWQERIHPEDRENVVNSMRGFVSGSQSTASYEYRLMQADGTYVQVVTRARLIRDAAGRPVRVVGSTVDVTDQRRLEEQVRQTQRLESIGKLTGGVAHDFNNILMAIMANVDEVLEDERIAAETRTHVERIGSAAERAAQLTRHLLAFSRRQMLRPQRLDVNDLVVGTINLFRRTLGENIEIDSALADNLWFTETDRAQLEAALINLCVNARDAMPNGGRLLIETMNASLDQNHFAQNPDVAAGEYVVLSVTDTGCGMSAEVRRRAVEPFFTTKPIGQGTGLGLSMVYGFVKQSRGHTTIDSELGRGTTVKIYLPRSANGGADAQRARELSSPRGSEAILVVEDEETVRTMVVQQLASLGYRVSAATNGSEGLAMLKAGVPCDLLLTDVVMPGSINGKQLADEAKNLLPDVSILFMSGYSAEAISSAGILQRGVNLLNKPFRKIDLAQAVRRAIEQQTT